jgi:hypothetical protein
MYLCVCVLPQHCIEAYLRGELVHAMHNDGVELDSLHLVAFVNEHSTLLEHLHVHLCTYIGVHVCKNKCANAFLNLKLCSFRTHKKMEN